MKKQSLVARAFGRVTSSKKAIDKLTSDGFDTIKESDNSDRKTMIKTPKKKKCFVLTIAKTFQANHPRHGNKTDFDNLIEIGQKIHTIRKNYDWWLAIAERVNRGEAYISIREWTGAPYHSKQRVLMIMESIHVQEIRINGAGAFVDDNYVDWVTLANNDGLLLDDFFHWFKPNTITEPMAVIQFTDFKY